MRTKFGEAEHQDINYMIAGDNCIEIYQQNKKNDTMHHLVHSIHYDSSDRQASYFIMKLDTLRPYKIYLTILCDELVLSHRSYTLEDIEAEAKFDEEMRQRHLDYDTADEIADMPTSKFGLYVYFMNEIVCTAVSRLMASAHKNHKMMLIKNEECPVLKIPLDENARKFMKCGHFISSQAFIKMLTKNTIKCPQCRAEHDCSDCTKEF